MNGNDEFYIGWESKAPGQTARRMQCMVISVLVLCLSLAAALAFAQRTIGRSVFEWGKVKEFSGTLRSQPYPHLISTNATYYLVNPFKFGFDPAVAAHFDGQFVNLKGTLIYRENQAMIEVVKGSVSAVERATPNAQANPVSFGEQTLVGEIVDSKCYLGVMNPGALTPHRACAIRCISGGIPAVLLVRQKDGPALYFLLVARDGSPVNKHVLDMVAEPVQITGHVERQGDLMILRGDPATYRRVGSL